MYMSMRGRTPRITTRPKKGDLVYGRSWRTPRAPVFAHCRASVLMSPSKEGTEGCALSKIAAFRCFQIHHAVSMTIDDVPLRNWRGAVRTTCDHHSAKSPSEEGGPEVDRIHERTSNQTVLENEHPVRRCVIVSSDWSHSGHLGACGKPRRASLSPVQHLSRQANHMKNFTLGGAQDLQFSSHDGEVIPPGRGPHSKNGRCTGHPSSKPKSSCPAPPRAGHPSACSIIAHIAIVPGHWVLQLCRDPGAVYQTHRTHLPAPFRDQRIHLRRHLLDGTAAQPSVLPEESGLSIANPHRGGGHKDVQLRLRELHVQPTPRTQGVSAHPPQPTHP
nr:uncharacterized protein LOC127333471 [Lolium perenne]